MAFYQLKVKYDVDKYGAVFISGDEALRFSKDMLYEKIRSVTSRFNHVKELKVKYLDDEKTFVNLPSDEFALSELFRCAVLVENADFKRITILIEESFSPVQGPLADNESDVTNLPRKRTSDPKSAFSPTSGPSAVKKEHCMQNVSRRSLDFQSLPCVTSSHVVVGRPDTRPLFKSPLEKFLQSQRERLSSLTVKEKEISHSIANYPKPKANVSRGSDGAGPTCSNCHRQEGHNRLNCPYNKCETVFHCGAINKHPEEKSNLKEYEKQRQDVLKEISRIQQDIDVKEKAAKSIQERYVNKVRHRLIESIPERYLDVGKDGNTVENWFQLNRDAKKLEIKLKGKLPPPDLNLKELLDDDSSTASNSLYSVPGKTAVRNPYKKLWVDRGVAWPTSPTTMNDDSLLAIGIQRSLNAS